MRLSRPSPDSFHPRPARGADILSGFLDEEDDGIEFDPQKDISEKSWDGMKEKYEGYRGGRWNDFGTMAMRLLLIFPDRKAELKLNDEAFDGMKGQLEKCRDNKNRWDFSYMAMNLSLLFPDRKADLNLDDAAFEGMKGELEEYRGNKQWWNFSRMARHLSILAAEHAQITHDGQILITHKQSKLSKEPKPLPQRLHI